MAKLVGNIPIEMVQGSTLNIRRKFDDSELELISKVYFICKDLNICGEFEKLPSGEFVYTITDEVSENFKPIVTTYDMTVEYLDGTVAIETGISFVVNRRYNPVTCGGGE